MNRWPTLILIAAMLAGLVVLEQSADPVATSVASRAPERGPVAAADGASGSTWYCPAGFTTPDGSNDHMVVITNQTAEPAVGTLTIYPSLLDTLGNPVPFDRAVQSLEVAANSQETIALAAIVATLDEKLATNTGAFVAALAEFDGAGVHVEHMMVAAQGSDIGACATSAGTSWWFASGTTTAEVGFQLYLLNPFPDDAVVDISFVTDAGSRSPTAFKGKLVPAQSLTVLQVSPEVPVNEQMTTQVIVKTGRVIAERLQLFENEMGPAGLSMSLGANRLADQWFFPAGRSLPGAGESYMIYNPGDNPAEVEFELKPDSSDRVGDVAPRAVVVGSRERWVVTVARHGAHPDGALASVDATTMVSPTERYFVSVRSFNGEPIVVERLISRPLADRGVTVSLGADLAAREQTVSLPAGHGEASAATLAVLNPAGDTIARADVVIGGPDGERTVARVELAPRRRAVFDATTLVNEDDQWISIISSTGVIAEYTAAIDDVLLSTNAVPVEGTTSIPELLAFE